LQRRHFIQSLGALAIANALPINAFAKAGTYSVKDLPKLKGQLTLYLGRGEGGLYEDVLKAIKKRNPEFKLKHLQQHFQFKLWAPITGRIRTIPFNTKNLTAKDIPDDIMAFPDSNLKMGWAPAYASFQSFVTAMRILKGDKVTKDWLKGVNSKAKKYAGELGVVMAVERGAIDVGFANHYYTLRLKSGKPNANIDLAFTKNDAGCLVNTSGIVALKQSELAVNFIRYLLTKEVQSYLANEAYEIPLVNNVATPAGLPTLDAVTPPKIDLTQLADLRPTIELMRSAGVL